MRQRGKAKHERKSGLFEHVDPIRSCFEVARVRIWPEVLLHLTSPLLLMLVYKRENLGVSGYYVLILYHLIVSLVILYVQ